MFYNKFISCLYMFRAHVLIIRSKLHYAASGIITPIGASSWLITEINILRCTVSKTSKIDGNVTLGKLNYTRAVYIFTQYLKSHTFSTTVYTVIHYISKKWRKQTIFNINTYFMIRTTYVEF